MQATTLFSQVNPTETTGILILPVSSGTRRIPVNTIIRIEAIRNYSKLFFEDGKTLVVSKVLAWFEERLPASLFLRIHRSHIVGLMHVQAYYKGHNSHVILHDNTAIDISKRKKSFVMKVFRSRVAA